MGERSFILGDRSLEKNTCDRSFFGSAIAQRAVGNRVRVQKPDFFINLCKRQKRSEKSGFLSGRSLSVQSSHCHGGNG
ncbi:hypothetical protein [Argonema antarcticum]|uniref:hypothetical protein n=1 Tax=Argonema antarcticum TaxID=2942763 RepID=UPI002011B435|nr:hypothetical protein [Argonema antarcticum]MCL1473590.1 hypothetical protein [Argonema antarcticum A004/B2]